MCQPSPILLLLSGCGVTRRRGVGGSEPSRQRGPTKPTDDRSGRPAVLPVGGIALVSRTRRLRVEAATTTETQCHRYRLKIYININFLQKWRTHDAKCNINPTTRLWVVVNMVGIRLNLSLWLALKLNERLQTTINASIRREMDRELMGSMKYEV